MISIEFPQPPGFEPAPCSVRSYDSLVHLHMTTNPCLSSSLDTRPKTLRYALKASDFNPTESVIKFLLVYIL